MSVKIMQPVFPETLYYAHNNLLSLEINPGLDVSLIKAKANSAFYGGVFGNTKDSHIVQHQRKK